MEQDFWHQRWSENKIGFHQQKVNSRLKKYWSQLKLTAGDKVLVPLCGKSADMLWLQQQGFTILGVELSPIACIDFFKENGLDYSTFHKDGFEVFQSGEIELWAGDFFELTSDHVKQIKGIYDRAALIALPPDMRQRYARHLADILPGPSRALYITMEYDQDKMKGPPFSVSGEEFEQLFQNDFCINLISESSGPDIVGNLKDRGLDTLTEKIYLLRK